MLEKVQLGLPESARLKLDDSIGRHGSSLSKGQELMLLVTRALLTRKPILLLDEPFQAVEPDFQVHLIQLLQRLRKKRTIVLLVKSHEVPDLEFDSITELRKAKKLPTAVIRKIKKNAS